MPERIKIGEKYEIVIDWSNGVFEAMRHGEPWRRLVGDNLALAMAQEIQDLRARLGQQHTSITNLCKEAHQNAIDKGWYEEPRTFGEVIALIHSEVSEALEEYRAGRGFREFYYEGEKPCGIPIELADVLIRIFDTCAHLGIDLEAAIQMKMAYNRTRPHKHGGKQI